jgi:hypothetical protein
MKSSLSLLHPSDDPPAIAGGTDFCILWMQLCFKDSQWWPPLLWRG